jgi:hypothetical protein
MMWNLLYSQSTRARKQLSHFGSFRLQRIFRWRQSRQLFRQPIVRSMLFPSTYTVLLRRRPSEGLSMLISRTLKATSTWPEPAKLDPVRANSDFRRDGRTWAGGLTSPLRSEGRI